MLSLWNAAKIQLDIKRALNVKEIYTLAPSKEPNRMPLKHIAGSSIWFMTEEVSNEESVNVVEKNAFQLLMNNSKSLVRLQNKDIKNKKEELWNDVVALIKEPLFRKQQLDAAQKFINTIVEALWAIDGNQCTINNAFAQNQCKGLPSFFSAVYAKEYRQWRTQKKAKPTLSSEKLLECSDNIFNMISAWDKLNFPSKDFSHNSRLLAESLKSYQEYLVKSKDIMAENEKRQ